jgi:hypothetical protein
VLAMTLYGVVIHPILLCYASIRDLVQNQRLVDQDGILVGADCAGAWH